jgi:hypothetical protein
MALKMLGQSKPAGGATTSLYQVGGGKSAVVANIICCNTDTTNTDYITVYQILAAGSPGASNAIVANYPVPPRDSFVLIAGLSLAAGESIRVVSTGGYITFTCSGSEQ